MGGKQGVVDRDSLGDGSRCVLGCEAMGSALEQVKIGAVVGELDVDRGPERLREYLEDVADVFDEWGAVDADENWLISGPNRVVEVAMDGTVSGDTSYVIPPWGDVSVTFMVDMNCHINLGVFDRDTGCVDVNIDGYPPVEMTYADTGVWAVTITRFNVGEELAYTYRINCAWETLGGEYDEYPGPDNNRTYTVVDGENSTGVELYQDDELGVGNNCPYTPGVSVEPVVADQVRVYPNPVYQELHVAGDFRIRSIDVFNITGQKVLSVTGINKFEQYLNVETLEQGLYIISVNGAEGERAITKVLKNR